MSVFPAASHLYSNQATRRIPIPVNACFYCICTITDEKKHGQGVLRLPAKKEDGMNTLVVYDSVFGNTEKVAQAIAQALGGKAVKVDAAPKDIGDTELLIVASPTRAFTATPALKAWVKRLPKGSLAGVKTAAFDTRMSLEEVDNKFLTFMAGIFGYAAEPLSKTLAKKGGTAAAAPVGYIVGGNEGPLRDGEMDRAIEWAKSCAS